MQMSLRFLEEEYILPQNLYSNQLDIKAYLNKMKGIPINQISIFSKGKVIPEDEKIFANDELLATTIFQGGEQIFVRTMDGRTATYDITSNMNIGDLKKKIFLRIGLPVDRQIIFFQGKAVENDQTMASIDIKAQAIVNLFPVIP